MADSRWMAHVTEIVRSVGRIGPEVDLGPETRLVEDLSLDSLALVEVIMKIEDLCGVVIDDDEASRLKTIGDLVGAIGSRRGSAAA